MSSIMLKKEEKMEKIQITIPPELLKAVDDFITEQKPITGMDRSQYFRELALKDMQKKGKI